MSLKQLYALVLVGLFMMESTVLEAQPVKWPEAKPPIATVKPREVGLHGDQRTDNYYWMGDYFFKGPDSAAVVRYLNEENDYLGTMMASTTSFQDRLYREMKGRIKEKDESVPYIDNGYYYYNRTETGQEYYLLCRKKGSLAATEEVMLNVNELAAGHPYYAVGGVAVSPNNALLAFAVDTVSRRQYTLQVKNLLTGEVYADAITNMEGSPVWANDNRTIYYTAKNPVTLLSEKIMKHVLGTPQSADVVVYEEKDRSNYIGVGKTKSDRYILIYSQATLSSEIRYADANDPAGVFRVFQPRIKDVLYQVEEQGNRFLILTNQEAKNFRLMEAPLDATGTAHWKEVVAHRPDVLLQNIEVFKDFLVLSERKNGLTQLQVRNLAAQTAYYLDFGEPVYTASVSVNRDYDATVLRYGYTSLTTPPSTYDFRMDTRQKTLMKQQEVVGGYKAADYVTERLWATAKDGTRVPISIVYRKDFVKDGKHPLLLYGYGSYGNSIDATFNSSRLSLLDRGFAFAIAHIRGGQEMGRQWYEDGKLMKKKNSFTDFIDCAEFLIAKKYTSKAHLYANGGSAGGLLMGAVINMRPDLWHGVVADVPFVDVVTTMLDESIPLTTNEFDEWGNPKNKEAYTYMKTYSPVDNVTKAAYPNLLVTTGLHDSQVQYFEPAKWVAKLRTHHTGNQVILLKTNMAFGHGGASGRFDYLHDQALRYAFYLKLEGIHQ